MQLPTAFEGGMMTVKHQVRQDLSLVEAGTKYMRREEAEAGRPSVYLQDVHKTFDFSQASAHTASYIGETCEGHASMPCHAVHSHH